MMILFLSIESREKSSINCRKIDPFKNYFGSPAGLVPTLTFSKSVCVRPIFSEERERFFKGNIVFKVNILSYDVFLNSYVIWSRMRSL